MVVSKILRGFAEKIQNIPRKTKLIIGMAVLAMPIISYVVWALIPKTIEFSYGGESCVRTLTFLPSEQKTDSTMRFSISYPTHVLGGLFAGKVCFSPTTAPIAGNTSVASTLFGWPFLRINYQVHTSRQPQVIGALTTKPVALTRPIVFTIDKSDTTYSYSLKADTASQVCATNDRQLLCHIDQLHLTQGSEQTIVLMRSFKGTNTVKLTEKKIAILPAVAVTDSSVKPNQVVYTKPRSFSFTLNKALAKATATLELINDTGTSRVDTATSVQGNLVTVTFAKDLDREKSFRLTLMSTEATDGSTISEPYIVPFSVSGGPKITGVNIGPSNVDPNASITISFDQTIDSGVDISQFATITGVSASTIRQGSQIVFRLHNATPCSAFTLTVLKGMKSATNDMVSKENWSYTSRITCRTTSTIGYSVRGRPIVAYFYGSGSTAILFTGGMHGSEPSGQQTMQAWANYLDSYAPNIPAGRQVVIVSNTNPDGIAAGTRLNANGVNIDRNFATADWQTDIQTTTGILSGGGGPSPMSEPETRAIGALTTQLRPRLEVSFHAAGSLVGANDYADSRTIGNIYATTVGYATMFGTSAEEVMGYTFSGQYEDYAAEKAGTPAILIELPTASGNYLSSQLNALWKMVRI